MTGKTIVISGNNSTLWTLNFEDPQENKDENDAIFVISANCNLKINSCTINFGDNFTSGRQNEGFYLASIINGGKFQLEAMYIVYVRSEKEQQSLISIINGDVTFSKVGVFGKSDEQILKKAIIINRNNEQGNEASVSVQLSECQINYIKYENDVEGLIFDYDYSGINLDKLDVSDSIFGRITTSQPLFICNGKSGLKLL
jgi:hypothetical protein